MVALYQQPKIFGVNIGNLLYFSSRASFISQKVKGRNKIVKTLTDFFSVVTKIIITATYEAVDSSILNYTRSLLAVSR